MNEVLKDVSTQEPAEACSQATERHSEGGPVLVGDPQTARRLNFPELTPKLRAFLLILGLLVLQVLLYGPSLAGRKVLLPLSVLSQPGAYLPRTAEFTNTAPHDMSMSDLVFQMEPWRRFAHSELQAGRLPMWAPYEFGGVPFIYPKFSPFLFLEYCFASPVVLAWAQLLEALVAGLGIYFFMRRALQIRYGPAALCAACYPLTAFFILWQGFPLPLPVAWLPWVLLAVDRTLRGTSLLAPVWLALTTCLVLVSGHVDVAGQVLLGSGLYALWCLAERGGKERRAARVGRGILLLVVGWGIGFALASPYLLPLIEYTRTGARMERRAAGFEARPPTGLTALPQVVFPDADSTMRGSTALQAESAAAGYAGVIAALLAAPLAFCNRGRLRRNVFWVLLLVFSLSWCLDLPVFTEILRLRGLNMLSHNRMVFLGGFAIIILAAEGLDFLSSQRITWRWWMWFPAGVLAALCLWYASTALLSVGPVQALLSSLSHSGHGPGAHELPRLKLQRVAQGYCYFVAATWCGIGLLGWFALRLRPRWQTALLPLVGGALVLELLCFAHGRNEQSDPRLYYPEVPALKELANSAPERMIGWGCLPPITGAVCGLWDIRGYDAVDPARMVELLLKTADPKSPKPEYALTQYLLPVTTMTPDGTVRLPAILDMLSVRYVVFRGALLPLAKPVIQSPDYWVVENPNFLPRVFVPHRAEVVSNDKARLEKLASPQFDPREVVYLETPTALPDNCRGEARIIDEIPTRVRIAVQMETPGLVVLSDRWDKGWHAYLDGREVPVLRANHAIRGVAVPAGKAELEFRYAPASFSLGLRLAEVSGVVILVWIGVANRVRRSGTETATSPLVG